MGVTHYPALWSPDFPLYANVQRPSGLLPSLLYLSFPHITRAKITLIVVEGFNACLRMPFRKSKDRKWRQQSCRDEIALVEKMCRQLRIQFGNLEVVFLFQPAGRNFHADGLRCDSLEWSEHLFEQRMAKKIDLHSPRNGRVLPPKQLFPAKPFDQLKQLRIFTHDNRATLIEQRQDIAVLRTRFKLGIAALFNDA